jgi:hypothetical protein
VARGRVKAIPIIRRAMLWRMTVRPGPGSPSTTMPADARDTVMMEEKIGLKFAEIRYRQLAACDASKQGPEDSFPGISQRGKCDVPQIYFRVEENQSKQVSRRPARNAAYDAGHRLLANSNSLDLYGLADGKLSFHHDRGAVAANVYCLAFLMEISAFSSARHANRQIQKNTFAKTLILVQSRKGSVTLCNSARARFVAGMVRHVAPLPMEELGTLLDLRGTSVASKDAEHSNVGWASGYSFFNRHANDNQVKEGFRRG